ncbi:MAG TPA: hypothetical protein PK156_13350 [Polyangium sp.]|nr:hypothetical protein [Polyangium sp.]
MIDVTRPSKAPESLASGSYGGIDVIHALHAAFLGKCYLCETKIEPGTLEVDHLKPKAEGQFPELKSAWTNLFATCNTHRCNSRRTKTYPEGGLLDPSAGDGVERRLRQTLDDLISNVLNSDLRCRFEAVGPDDNAAHNTARELDRIHNGTGSTERAQATAKALRKAIALHVGLVASLVREYLSLTAGTSERREYLDRELRTIFSRRAPYTMLVRSYFSHRPEIRALFEETR